jgi:Holliday junction DNA helicase RuvA
MIGYIRGEIQDVEADSCTVLTSGGVGYVLHLPGSALERLPRAGEETSFYVKTVLREEAIELYGFSTKQERQVFTRLVSLSKLGPKTALAILSTFNPDTLSDIVLREDSKALTRVQGIGPKSAKRILWELKEKLGAERIAPGSGERTAARQGSVYNDALSGLLNLGYAEEEAGPTLKQVLEEDPDLMVEEAIRLALKRLSSQRGEGSR